MIVKKQVIANFSRGAATYTQAASLQARIAQNLAYQLPGSMAEEILEIGCGTGLFTQHLIKAFPQADFLITDISAAMLEQCRQRATAFPNARFLCLDGEQVSALPQFDLITSSMTMHWFKDFAASLTSIKQKLKLGGRLLLAMLAENSLQEWRDICAVFQYPIATPYFPATSQLEKQFPEFVWRVETIKEPYPNIYTFLTTLKLIGATATRADYTQLTADKVRKLIRHFNDHTEMTYEVVYGEYRAP